MSVIDKNCNANTPHTTAHIDKNGVKHWGVKARVVAEREANEKKG